MADEDERRKRQREREDEQEAEELARKQKAGLRVPSPVGATTDRSDELIPQAESMIEQVDNLYNMYLSGAERLPPLQKRKLLEQIMTTLQQTKRNTPSGMFRLNSILSRFSTYRDRWEKMMKDLESGKIKRTKG